MPKTSEALDLLSTSQTTAPQPAARCVYGAPLVAMIFRNHAVIKNACCNHWDCPLCGQTRARQEYHRMVWGAQVLEDEGRDLYFYTFTCRGREMPLDEAESEYLHWTNLLLTKMRQKAGRAAHYWSYAQATERQERLHPHSHMLCTFLPNDALATKDAKGRDVYVSAWFSSAHYQSGLGTQTSISRADNIEATSRYIGKYLFKDTALTRWPAKWKRVRYSQNWPKPPHYDAQFAIALLKPDDWNQVEKISEIFVCETDEIFEIASHRLGKICKRRGDIDF